MHVTPYLRYFLLGSLILFSSACSENKKSTVDNRPEKGGEVCGLDRNALIDEAGSQPDPEALTSNAVKDYATPTRKLSIAEWPSFTDDLDFNGMKTAIARQLKRYDQIDLSGTIVLGGQKHSLSKAKASLEQFSNIILAYEFCIASGTKEKCDRQLNDRMLRSFDVYMPHLAPGDPRYGEPKQTLFTAYYSPLLNGHTNPTGKYKHPVYLSPAGDLKNTYDRVQIDFDKKLSKQGLEIFYADSLFDLYLLHVQGGGRVNILNAEGKRDSYYLSYAGTNGKSFRFISKYMVEKGYIEQPTIYAQRKFLKDNPSKQKDVYGSCPSYVYFSKSSQPPVGSDTVSLTDNRSIATDINYYRFKGLLSYVVAKRPNNKAEPGSDCTNDFYRDYSRFYLDQDTGGAIRGKARVDLYFGEGAYAELAAYNTVHRGDLYFLMLK